MTIKMKPGKQTQANTLVRLREGISALFSDFFATIIYNQRTTTSVNPISRYSSLARELSLQYNL